MRARSAVSQVTLGFVFAITALAHVRTIGERTARKLVQEALVAIGAYGPSVEIAHWSYQWAPEFYTFQAWRPNPDLEGPLLTYYFAVNPWTGDVWDAMGCERITSPAIEKERESILRKSKLPTEAQNSLHERSPCSAAETRVDAAEKAPGKKATEQRPK